MRSILTVIIALFLSLLLSSCGETLYDIKFTSFNTGSSASIRALHVVDSDVIWASGSSGTFFMSKDGGNTWLSDSVPGAGSDDLRSIHAWNSKQAIVFGTSNPGKAYMTTDGGQTWKVVYENDQKGIFFDSMKFADSKNGIALSDPVGSTSFVIHTIDGGASWTEVEGLPDLEEGEYNFAASNSCIDYHTDGSVWIISGGNAARAFFSKDHGNSWDVAETGLIHGNSSSGCFSVSFRNRDDGIVVGGTYDKPELNEDIAAWSSDGGVSWKLSEVMPREFRSNIIWLQDGKKNIAFALGKTGCDYSIDKGKSWMEGIDIEGYYTARPISGTLSGYAAGSDGKIAKFELIQLND